MSKKIENAPSPMMQDYLNTKEKYQDCILFYRLGDFYEMFFDDAVTVANELDLVLTGKQCGFEKRAPMCGVPHHAVMSYVARLVNLGYKVAICEQVPAKDDKKKQFDREVSRIITPGTLIDEEIIADKRSNYLLSIYGEEEKVGISYVDISTGEFETLEIQNDVKATLANHLARVMPAEIIANSEGKLIFDDIDANIKEMLPKCQVYYDWAYSASRANENLKKQLGANYAKVFELKEGGLMACASSGILEYVNETQKRNMGIITKIKVVKDKHYMTIDFNSRRNLELIESTASRSKRGSLFGVVDKTKTKMGGRRLRKMFEEPLQNSKEINERLNTVEEFVKKLVVRDRLRNLFSKIGDIERLAGRIAYGNVKPKDLIRLKESLLDIPTIKDILKDFQSREVKDLSALLADFSEICDLIERAIDIDKVEQKTGFLKAGFHEQLDKFRSAGKQAGKWLDALLAKETEATGIKNLKIDRNRVFGYFFEVNKSQLDKVPLHFERKQTIANNERFTTPDLKALEKDIVGAEENALKLESLLYQSILDHLKEFITLFQQTAYAIGCLDAYISLAECAVVNNYCRPVINDKIDHIKIVDGRHPVVETFSKNGSFIANDTFLNESTDRVMIITGPNMAGKSTYMRQVALITYLAHIGSFVPARQAEIALTDRIFTRIGASDDLASGQSTFMVEMSEVALILANATNKSLILLDEVGRGTSTFDGLSIAWSVIEYISKNFASKTLFATHYHELTDLEGVLEGVKNYKISVKETEDSVVFLRKILRGGTNKSFGIEVATIAGVPKEVISRAREICSTLEKVNNKLDLNLFNEKKEVAKENTKVALSIFNSLKDIDMNRVSPMTAFDLLNDVVTRAKEEK